MKKAFLLLIPSALLVLASCQRDSGSETAPAAPEGAPAPEAPAQSSAPAAPSVSAPSAPSVPAAPTPDAASAAIPSNAAAGLQEAAGFSSTITSSWDAMKGMDYAQKAQFVQQATQMISQARSHISTLQSLSSALPEGVRGKLMEHVGGMTGNIGTITELLGKADSIGAGDWTSYRGQVGTAIGLLGGQFSGLSGLL